MMPPHVEPEELALAALGERVDPAEEAHLTGCVQCQSELDQLRAVVTVARSVTSDDALVAPPFAVWDAVSAELGLTAGEPVPIRKTTGRRPALALAAAAGLVGVLVGIGATALVTASADEPERPVLASAALLVLADEGPGGDAEVRRDGTGRLLELEVPTLSARQADATGYYEVWLLRADGTGLVSVGLLDPAQGPRGKFLLPPGLDLAEFAVVDVSREATDGDPTHSGDSVLRGTLTT